MLTLYAPQSANAYFRFYPIAGSVLQGKITVLRAAPIKTAGSEIEKKKILTK